MKSAVIPQVRVEPELRAELEAVLHQGETLSEFVEASVRKAVEFRRVQTRFHELRFGTREPPSAGPRRARTARPRSHHRQAALQPRHAARRFIVFSPAGVEPPVYDANAQSILAVLRDAQGEPVLLRRSHERHAPHALDAIAAAAIGRLGPLRHVAGVLSWARGLPCLEPWALGCGASLVVPDLAAATGALAEVSLGSMPDLGGGSCAQRLEDLRQHLAALLHHGLARLPRSWPSEAVQQARRLEAAGLTVLGGRLHAFALEVAAARAHPGGAALALPLLALLGLRQLHADAAEWAWPSAATA